MDTKAGNARASPSPAARLPADSASLTRAARTCVWSKRTAVAINEPSVTSTPEISPAVEQPNNSAPGFCFWMPASSSSRLNKAVAPKTKTSCGDVNATPDLIVQPEPSTHFDWQIFMADPFVKAKL